MHQSEINRQKAIINVKKQLEAEGFELIRYSSTPKVVEIKCPVGHRVAIYWTHWTGPKKQRCSACYQEKRIQILTEEVKNAFEEHGYQLLEEVKNKGHTVQMICPRGHKRGIIPVNFMRLGERCGECAGNQKHTYGKVKNIVEAVDGYKLISTEYKNNKVPLLMACPIGHEFKASFDSFYAGHRCGECYGSKKYTQEDVCKIFATEGYIVISEYVSYSSCLTIKCPQGHNYRTTLCNWYDKCRCQKCGVSWEEREISVFLDSLQVRYTQRTKSLISPYEVDFLLHEAKVAIEYGSYYHHRPESLARRIKREVNQKVIKHWVKHYHLMKHTDCANLGVRLITFFEDTWYNKREQMKGFLQNQVGNPIKIFDGLSIGEIPWKEARDFLSDYHINGCGPPGRTFAVVKNKEVYQLAVFSSSATRTHVSRVCTKPGFRVVGGMAKQLFKTAVKELNLKEVFATVDRQYSDGGWFYRVGFQPIEVKPPSLIRHTRYKKLLSAGKIDEAKARAVYDCGRLIFKWPHQVDKLFSI